MTTSVDLAAALQALATQQAALMEAQTEALRLQRALVEHLLRQSRPAARAATAEGSATSHDPQPLAVDDSPTVAAEPPAEQECAPSSSAPPTSELADSDPHNGDIAGPTPGSDGRASGSLRASPRAARGVVARYFRAHPARRSRAVSQGELSLLGGLADIGDAGRLVLQFGPHRGATLRQVARADPAYLRTLALRAQRANVRAAALRLVSVLERLEAGAKSARKPSRRRS